MKRAITIVLLSLVVTVAAWSESCPAWANCPIDGAQSMLANTEYQGITAIGVYEHTTTTGQKHQFRVRCK